MARWGSPGGVEERGMSTLGFPRNLGETDVSSEPRRRGKPTKKPPGPVMDIGDGEANDGCQRWYGKTRENRSLEGWASVVGAFDSTEEAGEHLPGGPCGGKRKSVENNRWNET